MVEPAAYPGRPVATAAGRYGPAASQGVGSLARPVGNAGRSACPVATGTVTAGRAGAFRSPDRFYPRLRHMSYYEAVFSHGRPAGEQWREAPGVAFACHAGSRTGRTWRAITARDNRPCPKNRHPGTASVSFFTIQRRKPSRDPPKPCGQYQPWRHNLPAKAGRAHWRACCLASVDPLEHRAEKWEPVFRKNDATTRCPAQLPGTAR
jgi:hypothetical protein